MLVILDTNICFIVTNEKNIQSILDAIFLQVAIQTIQIDLLMINSCRFSTKLLTNKKLERAFFLFHSVYEICSTDIFRKINLRIWWWYNHILRCTYENELIMGYINSWLKCNPGPINYSPNIDSSEKLRKSYWIKNYETRILQFNTILI